VDAHALSRAAEVRARPSLEPRILVCAAYQRHSVARTFTAFFTVLAAATMYHAAATASHRSGLFVAGMAALPKAALASDQFRLVSRRGDSREGHVDAIVQHMRGCPLR
jgi:hypothetical protein